MGVSSRLKLCKKEDGVNPSYDATQAPTPATCPAVSKTAANPAKNPSSHTTTADIDMDISHAREIFSTDSHCASADAVPSSKRARVHDNDNPITDPQSPATFAMQAVAKDSDSDDNPILIM
jgi:hypothetical protein